MKRMGFGNDGGWWAECHLKMGSGSLFGDPFLLFVLVLGGGGYFDVHLASYIDMARLCQFIR